ncbi:hypothetical protein BKA70DRAFT_1271306 [Coprinopsis sp. MPI-PUGE-AT-0042]|nr:hypothetical protein BKA70DRAFT_1271306 [Coprinopsis sp. MPI-PUGE-AT-0042]
MSDFDHDIDDELLALAGDSEGRRKKSKQSSSRKRKSVESDSERDVESEEDADSDSGSDPYPFEGKYVDEEDKQRLLEMPEIRREEILAERIEAKQRLQEKQVLAQMVKQQRSGGVGGTFDADEDSVAKAAKRQHTARGATKEKTRKLDELKAKRKAKDESRKRVKLSPNANRRSSSPQDMDISDEDSEDGQITKSDQEEERERRLLGLTSKKEVVEDNSPATVEDFNRCRLTRDLVAKWCMAPWFDKYVQDAWVRYLIGNREGEAIYRMCAIQGISTESTKPYKVNDRTVNQMVDLQHGKSVKAFNMDRISNAPFSQGEFERLTQTCQKEKVKLPTKKELQTKSEEMRKLQTQPMTDSDITAMLKKKKEMSATQSNSDLVLEKQGLHQARSLALKRQDYKEASEIADKISELEIRIHGSSNGASPKKAVDDKDEILRRVNERNRKANLDAVRRAEVAESERKRREREATAKAAATGGAAAVAAVVAKFDPSARLKTMPRLFNAATPGTRPGTPASKSGTPVPGSNPSASANASDSLRPLPTANTTMAFEKKLLDDIDIDLGDF